MNWEKFQTNSTHKSTNFLYKIPVGLTEGIINSYKLKNTAANKKYKPWLLKGFSNPLALGALGNRSPANLASLGALIFYKTK